MAENGDMNDDNVESEVVLQREYNEGTSGYELARWKWEKGGEPVWWNDKVKKATSLEGNTKRKDGGSGRSRGIREAGGCSSSKLMEEMLWKTDGIKGHERGSNRLHGDGKRDFLWRKQYQRR